MFVLAAGSDARRLQANPLFFYGLCILVFGVVISSVGGACTHDNLLGIDRCHTKTGFWLTAIGVASFVPGGTMVLAWFIKRRQLRRHATLHGEKSPETPFMGARGAIMRALGPILMLEGLILAIVGGLCMEDALVGVENCHGA
jgi:hypothetical protein